MPFPDSNHFGGEDFPQEPSPAPDGIFSVYQNRESGRSPYLDRIDDVLEASEGLIDCLMGTKRILEFRDPDYGNVNIKPISVLLDVEDGHLAYSVRTIEFDANVQRSPRVANEQLYQVMVTRRKSETDLSQVPELVELDAVASIMQHASEQWKVVRESNEAQSSDYKRPGIIKRLGEAIFKSPE